MTRKAKELAMNFFRETQEAFPELTFVGIMPSPELRRRYWIMVTGAMTEKRKREMRRFVADRATDVLIDEGYSFAVKLEHTLETA